MTVSSERFSFPTSAMIAVQAVDPRLLAVDEYLSDRDPIPRDTSADRALVPVLLLPANEDRARLHERTARFMERIGIELLRSEVLTLLPYIPLETVK